MNLNYQTPGSSTRSMNWNLDNDSSVNGFGGGNTRMQSPRPSKSFTDTSGMSLNELKKTISELEQTNFDLKLRIFYLEERQQKLESAGADGGGLRELVDLKQTISQRDREIDQLARRNHELERQLTSVAEANADLEDQLQGQADDQRRAAGGAAARQRAELDLLEQQLRQERARASVAKAQQDEVVAALEQELGEYKERAAAGAGSMARHADQVEFLLLQDQQKVQQVTEYQREILKLVKELEAARAHAAGKDRELAATRAEVAAARGANAKTKEKELEAMRLRAELAVHEDQLQEQGAELARHRRELAEIRRSAEEVCSLEAEEIQRLEGEVARLTKAVEGHRETERLLHERMQQNEADAGRARQQVAAYRAAHEEQAQRHQQEMAELRGAAQDLAQRLGVVQDQNAQLSWKLAAAAERQQEAAHDAAVVLHRANSMHGSRWGDDEGRSPRGGGGGGGGSRWSVRGDEDEEELDRSGRFSEDGRGGRSPRGGGGGSGRGLRRAPSAGSMLTFDTGGGGGGGGGERRGAARGASFRSNGTGITAVEVAVNTAHRRIESLMDGIVPVGGGGGGDDDDGGGDPSPQRRLEDYVGEVADDAWGGAGPLSPAGRRLGRGARPGGGGAREEESLLTFDEPGYRDEGGGGGGGGGGGRGAGAPGGGLLGSFRENVARGARRSLMAGDRGEGGRGEEPAAGGVGQGGGSGGGGSGPGPGAGAVAAKLAAAQAKLAAVTDPALEAERRELQRLVDTLRLAAEGTASAPATPAAAAAAADRRPRELSGASSFSAFSPTGGGGGPARGQQQPRPASAAAHHRASSGPGSVQSAPATGGSSASLSAELSAKAEQMAARHKWFLEQKQKFVSDERQSAGGGGRGFDEFMALYKQSKVISTPPHAVDANNNSGDIATLSEDVSSNSALF